MPSAHPGYERPGRPHSSGKRSSACVGYVVHGTCSLPFDYKALVPIQWVSFPFARRNLVSGFAPCTMSCQKCLLVCVLGANCASQPERIVDKVAFQKLCRGTLVAVVHVASCHRRKEASSQPKATLPHLPWKRCYPRSCKPLQTDGSSFDTGQIQVLGGSRGCVWTWDQTCTNH